MSEIDPGWKVTSLLTAYWASRCLHVVADLGVADALGDGPETVASIAGKVGAHPQTLGRVLRCLANEGVFEQVDGGFAHNAASRTLRTQASGMPPGVRRYTGNKMHWNAYGELEEAVRTGRPAFELVAGKPLFDYLEEHPEEGRSFDESMTVKAAMEIRQIGQAYDFTGFGVICDVGGGRGHLLEAILQSAPAARGVLFDLPGVIERARAQAGQRTDYVPGDLFTDPPPPADAYVLMHVLHNWPDEEAVAILSNLRRGAPKDARILVIEGVIAEGSGYDFGKALDIEMLVLTTGRERSEAEFRQLFDAAGLRLERVLPAGRLCGIIEVSVVP